MEDPRHNKQTAVSSDGIAASVFPGTDSNSLAQRKILTHAIELYADIVAHRRAVEVQYKLCSEVIALVE
jgi:hypothetical protein